MAIGDENGALSLLGDSLDSETDDHLENIRLFQLQSQELEPIDGQRLQDVYGTSALPVFEWVRSIQTGERSYNPADAFDQNRAEEYKQLQQQDTSLPELPGVTDLIKGSAPQIGAFVGSRIASSAMDPIVQGMAGDQVGNVLSEFGKSLLPDFAGGGSLPTAAMADATSSFLGSGGSAGVAGVKAQLGNNVFVPELASEASAMATGNLDVFNTLLDGGGPAAQIGNNLVYSKSALDAAVSGSTANATIGNSVTKGITSQNITSAAAGETYMSGVGKTLTDSNVWGSAGIGAIVSFGIGVAMGQDPVKAAKSAGAAAIGGVIGNAIGGPIGGFIGSTLGGMIGGRVICNELQRQGLMTRKQIVLDYKFTRDYLTPAHVDGYHYWAIHVVRQLRQGKNVKLWKHIATHRVNEIAYIYGERDKPDYLGKIYRHIGEPACWVIGKLKNKESDWSVLYQQKEI
jgi:hypothetical protein